MFSAHDCRTRVYGQTMVIRLGLAQHVAAAKLGVNPGRINDVIHGRIFPDAPFAPLNTID